MVEGKVRTVRPVATSEARWWLWLRITGVLMVLFVFPHVIVKDVIVGVQNIDTQYVAQVWENVFVRVFDFLLLFTTFTHGMVGLRQVLMDFIHSPAGRKATTWILAVIWLVVSLMGTIAIIGGVRLQPGA